LSKNEEKLTVLAELLLEKEVIFKDDLTKIFGKRPFDNSTTEEKASEKAPEKELKKEEKEETKEETKEENKN
jgi:cell division protease FtsH